MFWYIWPVIPILVVSFFFYEECIYSYYQGASLTIFSASAFLFSNVFFLCLVSVYKWITLPTPSSEEFLSQCPIFVCLPQSANRLGVRVQPTAWISGCESPTRCPLLIWCELITFRKKKKTNSPGCVNIQV